MRQSLHNRLSKIEARVTPPPRFFLIQHDSWRRSPEEITADLKAVHEQARPGDTVCHIVYKTDWRPPADETEPT